MHRDVETSLNNLIWFDFYSNVFILISANDSKQHSIPIIIYATEITFQEVWHGLLALLSLYIFETICYKYLPDVTESSFEKYDVTW